SDHDSSGHLISPDYGYLPIRSVSLMFVALFGLSTVVHFLQALYSRAWWLLPTVILGGCGEVAGWYCRAWSHQQPLNDTPYTIQVLALILAPTPLVGGLFIAFGRMVARLGQRYSRLSPRLYSRIFLTCDIVALLIQASGGGIASGNDDVTVAKVGSNIMLGGIIFQLAALVVFGLLLVEYLLRYNKDRPIKKPAAGDAEMARRSHRRSRKSALRLDYAVGHSVCQRSTHPMGIYRTVELADGWNGKVIKTQSLFIIFDGVMVFGAMFVLNVCHLGILLKALVSLEEGAIPLTKA
ncbi:RTA1 like protein, partial [Cubamyces sp. BRFM 1775]